MNKKKIILIGAGSHAHSCIDIIERNSDFEIIGLIDNQDIKKNQFKYPIIGNDNDLIGLSKEYENAFITIGQIKDSKPRIDTYKLLKSLNYNLPSFKSENAYCSKNSFLGEASIVMHGCIINSHSEIGINCIINSKALIEHNVIIGNHNHISTGVIINGNVDIGNNNFIGSGSIINNNIKIGNNCIISSGSIVKSSLENNSLVK